MTLSIQDKSRMREIRSYGSVRGVEGNHYPYRDFEIRFLKDPTLSGAGEDCFRGLFFRG